MKSIEIKILGRSYYFKSDEPEKLIEIAKYVEKQLENLNERFNTVDQNKLLVLYAISMTEKYLSEIDDYKSLSKQYQHINELLEKIEIDEE
ncbi:MAG: cell division protein ZapA [Candidatus Cloacimonetes bacterium]|nr:cell division protein ZapA [Candidatus Cloacimonadota bacterium]